MTTMLLHKPVLLQEIVELLSPPADATMIDGTLGMAGHAAALLESTGPGARLLGLDQDPAAVDRASENLERFGDRVRCRWANFEAIGQIAQEEGFVPATTILLDLGFSTVQLDDARRGFSFNVDGPLDMRLDPTAQLTAERLVNSLSEERLANLIYELGEERRSRRIAKAIVRRRPLHTTLELADAVRSAVPADGGIHPATRTFMAIRIAVNDELDRLRAALQQVPELLGIGGRVGVISFHSLEDRIVKEFFRTESAQCICPPKVPVCVCNHRPTLRLVNRRIVDASAEELRQNPRARSARLRVAERI